MVIRVKNSEGNIQVIKVTDELIYKLASKQLKKRTEVIVDRFCSDIMPGIYDEHIREVIKEDSKRGEKGGGQEPTGTRKTMRECMSRAQTQFWDGKL